MKDLCDYLLKRPTFIIADLKVELNSNYLICSTTCILPNPTYIWYKNGQLVSSGYKYKYDWSQYYNIYACATKGNEKLRSTSVCKTIILLVVQQF